MKQLLFRGSTMCDDTEYVRFVFGEIACSAVALSRTKFCVESTPEDVTSLHKHLRAEMGNYKSHTLIVCDEAFDCGAFIESVEVSFEGWNEDTKRPEKAHTTVKFVLLKDIATHEDFDV